MKHYRQGDVLLIEGTCPAKADRRRDSVLVYGEATGHAHRVENGVIMDSLQGPYVLAGKDTSVTHDEHDTIVLPEGEYRVIRQREFDEEAIRYVAD